MSSNRLPGLFPMADDDPPPTNVVELRGTGILPAQQLREMIENREIASIPPIAEEQIQPASLDLRLGKYAYRVRASFLPGPGLSVMERVHQLGKPQIIDLSAPEGAVLEKGEVYVVEILESVRLTNGVEGRANPKSSTGRLDVLTRLITDKATAFDRIDKRYHGPLYVEVAPLTFSIRARQGSRLTQVRFQRGSAELTQKRLHEYHASQRTTQVFAVWGLRSRSSNWPANEKWSAPQAARAAFPGAGNAGGETGRAGKPGGITQ